MINGKGNRGDASDIGRLPYIHHFARFTTGNATPPSGYLPNLATVSLRRPALAEVVSAQPVEAL